MNISYHSWKDYAECPKKYLLKDKLRKSPPLPANEYFTIYGKLTEKFFQMFCNIWRFKLPYMPEEEIKYKLDIIYRGLLPTLQVNWDAPFVKESKEDIFNQSCSDICAIMASQNQNYFFNTRSETKIEIEAKDDTVITGRIDFIHKDPMGGGVTIFDGKGTTELGKNISDDQLYFYALLYYFHFKEVPEGLGFFYYRFNTYKPVPVNMNYLDKFRASLSSTVKNIKEERFPATPSYKSCKYCDYQTICQDCQEDRIKRKKGSRLKPSDMEGLIELGV
jgi:CRISPR/Cas system-associated exonuclease Cas4 (RecB family)